METVSWLVVKAVHVEQQFNTATKNQAFNWLMLKSAVIGSFKVTKSTKKTIAFGFVWLEMQPLNT